MSILSRKREVLMTVASNVALQLVTAVCGFILPPLIVRTFGSDINGMVQSISQFIAYLNIVEAGIGAASIATLYRPLADGDSDGVSGIVSAARLFYMRSGVAFTVLVFALSLVYPLVVGSQVDRTTSGLMVLVLGITGAAEFFLIGKYRVLLTADRKTYIISLAQIVAVVLNTCVAVALIKIGFGILTVKLASAIVYLSRYLWLSAYVRLHYGWVDFRHEPNRGAVSQSRNVMVHQVAGLVVFNSPVVLITIFCSLKDASIYTMYAMVFSAVNQILSAFSNGIQSFFGESLVKDAGERTAKLFGLYETFFFTVLAFVYSMAFILIIPFMSVYTRNLTDAEYIQPILGILFVLVGIANNLRNPANQVIGAAGHFRQTQWRALAEATINIIASVLFTLWLGFRGVLLGSLCSYAYRTADMIIYANRRILKRSSFASLAKILALGIVFGLAGITLRRFLPECGSWGMWILIAAVCGAILFLPAGAVGVFVVRKKDKVL